MRKKFVGIFPENKSSKMKKIVHLKSKQKKSSQSGNRFKKVFTSGEDKIKNRMLTL